MRRSFVAICGFSLLLAACPSGDDGGGNETGEATESATTDTPTGGTMMATMTTDPSMTSTPGTTGDMACDATDQALIDMCKAQAEADGQCPEVGDCNCDACACELAACEADAGCTAIRECAQEVGCMGIDCLEPENCMQVIDDAGGVGGESAMIALDLNGCVEAAMCPIQCEGGSSSSTTTGEGGSSSSTGG